MVPALGVFRWMARGGMTHVVHPRGPRENAVKPAGGATNAKEAQADRETGEAPRP